MASESYCEMMTLDRDEWTGWLNVGGALALKVQRTKNSPSVSLEVAQMMMMYKHNIIIYLLFPGLWGCHLEPSSAV